MKINKIDFAKNYIKHFNKKSILETKKVPLDFLYDVSCYTEERFPGTIHKLPDYYSNKKVLFVDSLKSYKKGSGSKCLKNIVRKSLKNPDTEGRVTLISACVDHKTNPFGFYYKMGFRSTNEIFNNHGEWWLKRGGEKEDAPWIEWSYMYLPKENISQCLNYKCSNDAFLKSLTYKPIK